MAGINDYSNTAGSNTTINGIDIAEGCSPAGINNAIRQLMADIADVDDGVVPLQTPDINGGTIDGAAISGSSTINNSVIGGTTPAAGTFTTLTANTSITGTLNTAAQTNITSVGTLTGLTVAGNVSIDGGTIKLDGNYPVGTNNVALGNLALDDASLTGGSNTGIGYASLSANTTGTNNTSLGYLAGTSNTTGSSNVFLGRTSGQFNTTGNSNTFVGVDSGNAVSTGSKNTILGRYSGNQGGLDIRTSSNNIVLSDGDGNVRAHCDSSGNWTGIGGTNTPAFQATRTANQTMSANTWQKVNFDSEIYDTDSAYDNSTNYRFTIPSGKGGKYSVSARVRLNDNGSNRMKGVQLAIYKNGSEYAKMQNRRITEEWEFWSTQIAVVGSFSAGDYLEIYLHQETQGANTVTLQSSINNSSFEAFKLIE